MTNQINHSRILERISAGCSNWSIYSYKNKSLEGSPIYIPKRHKFKRRNKR